MRNLGAMSHFCINEYGLSPEEFSNLFANSHVAEQISMGNPRFLTGLSGKEMADMLIESTAELKVKQTNSITYQINPEYWAGWVLAYYQWYSAKSFRQMYADGQTYEKILMMYHPMHEADLAKIVEMMG
ncbi:MAG: hypothetical protein KBT04_08345 [Bacteroidales bacterium]|nr:hypothetical protein [Candidatus Colimorpha onthohippi]